MILMMLPELKKNERNQKAEETNGLHERHKGCAAATIDRESAETEQEGHKFDGKDKDTQTSRDRILQAREKQRQQTRQSERKRADGRQEKQRGERKRNS